MIVVDANILVPFWMSTDFSSIAAKVHETDSEWVAPYLWRSEVRNAMTLYMRQDLLSLGEALEFLEKAEEQMRDMEFHVNSTSVMRLAGESNATAYDCEYISLAKELGLPLVTIDRKLLASFPDIALSPEQYLESS